MAAAGLGLAAVERSWGWLFGGVVLLAVAILSLWLLRQEGTEPAQPSGRFALVAMGVAIVAMVFFLWLGSP